MISCVWTGPTAFRTKLSYAPIATYEACNWAHAGVWWLQRHAREYIHTTNIHTYMFVLVNFAALADKLSSSAECRIRNRVFGTEPPADWMPADNPTKLSRIKLKNLNSTARPYDQRAFSPLDPIAIWPITLSTVSERLCLFVKNWLLTVLGCLLCRVRDMALVMLWGTVEKTIQGYINNLELGEQNLKPNSSLVFMGGLAWVLED